MDDEDQLEDKLEQLTQEHRELDECIDALVNDGGPVDFIKMQRLKKRKLQIKDQIERIKSLLLPDIIA